MAEHVLEVCPSAIPSWYDDVGHMPFWEEAERFDRELGQLVDRGTTGPTSTTPSPPPDRASLAGDARSD